MQNGHSRPGFDLSQGVIIGQQVKKWRCEKGHEFTGHAPMVVLPVNPQVLPQQGVPFAAVVANGVCLNCYADYLARLFPVFEVGADGTLMPREVEQ